MKSQQLLNRLRQILRKTIKVNKPVEETQLFKLNRLLTDLVQVTDLESVLNNLLAASQETLSCDGSAIYLLGKDGQTIERTCLMGVSPEYASLIMQNYHELPGGTVLKTGEAVCIENVLSPGLYGDRLLFIVEYGWMALSIFPIQVKDQAIGALVAYYRQPHQTSTQERLLGASYASLIALNVQNVRYAAQLEQAAQTLSQRVKTRTAELQSSKERIEAILSSMPDAIFVLEDGNLALANEAAQELLIQANIDQIDLFSDDWLKRLEKEEIPSEKAVIETGGRFYQALSSALCVGAQDIGRVIVYRDVTRFREIDDLKSQFVSDVSHELRTPLANLTLYLDLLGNIQDAEKRENYMQVLQRENKRLTVLIEDLLTISRLEAGRLQVKLESINVAKMLSELAYDRSLMASGQGLKLHYENPKHLPDVGADPVLLNQCISNLLTNAINYTPPGGTISVDVATSPVNNTEWVLISISDTGVGILPEELPHIFNRFYRGAASRQTNAPGTGLGLSISKELIEKMGGKLTVQSTPGQGSEFTIWLPEF